jgi:hypothetical protein
VESEQGSYTKYITAVIKRLGKHVPGQILSTHSQDTMGPLPCNVYTLQPIRTSVKVTEKLSLKYLSLIPHEINFVS